MEGVSTLLAVLVSWAATHTVLAAERTDQAPAKTEATAAAGQVQTLTLEQCLEAAMRNNHRRPASRFAVAMAETQHRQALAGYWPQVNAKGGWLHTDEATNFLFPATTLQVPAQTISVPAGTVGVTIPANAFASGFPPASIQLPISSPGQSLTSAAQLFAIPAQDIKVADPDSFATSGNLTWLLYDGGMRTGYRELALGAVAAAQAEVRRTIACALICRTAASGWTGSDSRGSSPTGSPPSATVTALDCIPARSPPNRWAAPCGPRAMALPWARLSFSNSPGTKCWKGGPGEITSLS